jgi:iron complex transport system ATP-binding protein
MRGGLWGAPSAADRDAVESSLIAVDLINDSEKEISRLSGGQLQRVFLARALAQDPDIILLDEPTNHLDLKYQVELVDYLLAWRLRAGKGVIGVLHDINLAMRLADRVMLMREGEVYAIGAANDVVTSDALREVFNADVAGYMLESLRRWEQVLIRDGL